MRKRISIEPFYNGSGFETYITQGNEILAHYVVNTPNHADIAAYHACVREAVAVFRRDMYHANRMDLTFADFGIVNP